MYGVDVNQFKQLVVQSTLLKMVRYGVKSGYNVTNLILGTALKESLLIYVKQLDGGPALGFYQMEPATHADIWLNFLRYKPEYQRAVLQFVNIQDFDDNNLEQALIGNAYYATAMCRMHYLRVAEAVPGWKDDLGLATYWKQYYNTPSGKGTVEEALKHFTRACA